MEKCLKISQNVHGGDRKHIEVYKKQKLQNQQVSYFSPLCQLQLYISQNRLVLLVLLGCIAYYL